MDVFGLIDVSVWLLIGLLLLLVTLSIWYNFKFYTHFRRYGIDGPTPYPFVGNTVRQGFLWNEILLYEKYKSKRCFGSFLLGAPTLTITDVNLMKEILVKQFNKFTNRRSFSVRPPPFNKVMTDLVDDHWKHIRSMTTPAFTTGKLKNMTRLVLRASHQFTHNLKGKSDRNEEVDIKEMCCCFTMDAVASTMFGIQVDSQKNQGCEFVRRANEVMKFSIGKKKVLLALMCPKLASLLANFGISLFDVESTDFFANVCKQSLEQRKKTPGQFNDFLDMMIKKEVPHEQVDRKTKYPNGETIDWNSKGILRDEILSQAVIFMPDDSTATSLHFLFYRLALDQDIQQTILKELAVCIGEDEITYDNVSKLPYLDMCIQETLRMYPPAIRFCRTASEDVTIDGITIAKGTSVGIPAYAIHHDPEIYPDPQTFDPLRSHFPLGYHHQMLRVNGMHPGGGKHFTDEAKAKRSQYHWMPFGMGPRNCIGMRLALLMMKIAAAAVLQKCKFSRAPNTTEPENLKFEVGKMRPNPPIVLKVTSEA